MPATFTIDDREWQAYYRRFTPQEIDKVMTGAASAGARAAAKVFKSRAPLGRSRRPSQFYRQNSGQHGAFARSVRAAKVRRRGINARTIAYLVGPMGRWGFTRSWIAGGVKPHGGHPGQRANPWFDQSTDDATDAAATVSKRILEKYAD